MACYGAVYSIPSTSVFGRKAFSARQMNAIFIGVPLVLLVNVGVLGIVHAVKFGELCAFSVRYVR